MPLSPRRRSLDKLEVIAGAPDYVVTPSKSGKGQEIVRCPACRVAVWSHYSGAGRRAAFVRVGALGDPSAFPPDVHIFTSTKQAWVALPDDARAFAEFYPSSATWRTYDFRTPTGLPVVDLTRAGLLPPRYRVFALKNVADRGRDHRFARKLA